MTARISALDALRGLAIIAMVLVNNPGSWQAIYAPLKHAEWHGLTPTDVIFPGFIFVMGVTIAIHLPRELTRLSSTRAVVRNTTRRAIILVLLGWGLYLCWYNTGSPGYSWFEQRFLALRFAGVLPRLGVVYWLTVLLILAVSWRWVGVLAIVLLAGYWGAMEWIPYADACGGVYQGRWEFGNSLAAYLDHHLLGAEHVYYSAATPFAFDPEGILSTVPAVVTCLTGVWAGRYVLVQHGCPTKLMMLALAGICAGYGLAVIVPINKALWSPTFVLVTSGILTLLFWLSILYERKAGPLPKGHPLLVAGTNSIAFFMLSGILARVLLIIKVDGVSLKGHAWRFMQTLPLPAEMASLLLASAFLIICYYPIKLMYNNGFFWRI